MKIKRNGSHLFRTKAKKLERTITSPSPRSRRRPSGFTLVELLVVIGIVVLLAVLALPVSSGMAKKTSVSKDLANLRRIGTATALYVTEWSSYPGAGYVRFGRVRSEVVDVASFDYSPMKENVHLAEKLFPYFEKNKNFYRSPLFSDKDDPEKTTNYRHNINVYGYLKENRNPSRAALAGDKGILWMVSGYDNLSEGGKSLFTVPLENKRNYLYTDGHTERLKIEAAEWDPTPDR